MKRRDILNPIAFYLSKKKLEKSFSMDDFDSLYDFAQTYTGRGYFDRISLTQFKEEFRGLANAVVKIKPRTILEIGTKKGGSFFIWCRYTNAKHLISIDLPDGLFGGGYTKKKIPFMKHFVSDKKGREVSVILGDSHADDTYNKLRATLKDEYIDFLFIDGDHSYEGVKKDFETYKHLVRKGGIIAFHDIVNSEYHHRQNCFVDKFWNEIKNSYDHIEIIENPGQHKYGIGILNV